MSYKTATGTTPFLLLLMSIASIASPLVASSAQEGVQGVLIRYRDTTNGTTEFWLADPKSNIQNLIHAIMVQKHLGDQQNGDIRFIEPYQKKHWYLERKRLLKTYGLPTATCTVEELITDNSLYRAWRVSKPHDQDLTSKVLLELVHEEQGQYEPSSHNRKEDLTHQYLEPANKERKEALLDGGEPARPKKSSQPDASHMPFDGPTVMLTLIGLSAVGICIYSFWYEKKPTHKRSARLKRKHKW